MSIPTKLKHFLILSITFGIVYWFQHVDDKKRCKKREGIYEYIKLPLLVSSIVALILYWDNDKIFNVINCNNVIPVNDMNPNIVAIGIPSSNNNNYKNNPEFDVYTGYADF